MGWNDRLADPDAWEQHAEALAFRADLDRMRQREQQADAARLDRSSVERATEEQPVFGALARAAALTAGHPEWWMVTRWPVVDERALVDGPDGFDCGGIAA